MFALSQLSPPLSLPAALVKLLFTLLFTRISMSENKALPAFRRGETGPTHSSCSFSLSVSWYHTSPSLFLYITRFKAQTVPCGKCLTADSFLSALTSDCIIQAQKHFSVYPEVTLTCGQSSPCCPAPAAMYSQFTVTRTCLTSAEATSLAALHSYLPDCSRVIPRISRYSSSPSNSLPGRT